MRKRFAILFVLLLFVFPTSSAYAVGAETVVYITRTGHCYHREGCTYLKSKIPITLQAAIDAGYDHCSRCHPPTEKDIDSAGVSYITPYRSKSSQDSEKGQAKQEGIQRASEILETQSSPTPTQTTTTEEKKDRDAPVIVLWLLPALAIYLYMKNKEKSGKSKSWFIAPSRTTTTTVTAPQTKLQIGQCLYGKHKRTGNINYVIVVACNPDDFVVEYFGKRYHVPYSYLGTKLYKSRQEAAEAPALYGNS